MKFYVVSCAEAYFTLGISVCEKGKEICKFFFLLFLVWKCKFLFLKLKAKKKKKSRILSWMMLRYCCKLKFPLNFPMHFPENIQVSSSFSIFLEENYF